MPGFPFFSCLLGKRICLPGNQKLPMEGPSIIYADVIS